MSQKRVRRKYSAEEKAHAKTHRIKTPPASCLRLTNEHALGVTAYAMGHDQEGGQGHPDNLSLSAKLDYKFQFSPYTAFLLGAGGGTSVWGL